MKFIREEKAGGIKQSGAGLELIMTPGTMILPGRDFMGLAPLIQNTGIVPLSALGDKSG